MFVGVHAMALQQQIGAASSPAAAEAEERSAASASIEVGAAGLTPQEFDDGINALECDLAYILEDSGVEARYRGYIGHLGLVRFNAFAMLAPNEERMSEVIKEDFNLDPRSGIKSRVQHAMLLDAWDRAKRRVSAAANLAAEASAAGQQVPLPKGTQLSLRRKYEAVFGEVSDSTYPSKDYLLGILEQVEEGEYVAEELSAIVNWDQNKGQTEDVMLSIGTVKVRGNRKKVTGPRPKQPEELRKLYRVMWTAWAVVRLKHPEQRALKDIGREVFETLLDYLLGDRCWERRTMGKSISWEGLLSYELRIRMEAAKFCNRGKGSLAEGLRHCMDDANLRTEYYVEVVAMGGVKRTRSPSAQEWPEDHDAPPRGKGKGKGKNKYVKGKGKKSGDKGGKNGDKGDDRGSKARQAISVARRNEKLKFVVGVGGKQAQVCLRFNKLETCRDCRFEHVCLRCGGAHPLIDCTEAPTWK